MPMIYMRTDMTRAPQVFAVLVLSACTMAVPSADAGCRIYGEQRRDMPPLGTDAVSRWAAITDSAMTGACT